MEDEGNRVFTYKGYFKKDEVFCFAALSGDAGWSSQVAPGVPEGATFGLAPYSDNSLTNGSAATMKSLYDSYYIVTADLNSSALKTRTYNPNPVGKLYVMPRHIPATCLRPKTFQYPLTALTTARWHTTPQPPTISTTVGRSVNQVNTPSRSIRPI